MQKMISSASSMHGSRALTLTGAEMEWKRDIDGKMDRKRWGWVVCAVRWRNRSTLEAQCVYHGPSI